ncbi:MAG: cytochrome ubiquinol oxidase subunit I [Candidatus Anammoxibacter sp.]
MKNNKPDKFFDKKFFTVFIAFALTLVFYAVFASITTAKEAGASEDYRSIFGMNPRILLWVIAELHLMFGAFVLGVPMFAVVMEMIYAKTRDEKLDNLAHEMAKLLSAAFATTAALGGLMAFTLITCYPTFSHELVRIFGSAMWIYAMLFFGETFCLYAWYYSWDLLKDGHLKIYHITIGIFLNLFGTAIMMAANSWATFMMAPSGINVETGEIESLWRAIANPLWNPVNIHRILGNLAFGGILVGAYAAVKFLGAKTQEEKEHYDWMGYIGNFVAMCALIPLPFAGYYLGREVYSASAIMGNQMMGGAFSWPFIVQVTMVSVIFVGANYYLWLSIQRIPGGERYNKFAKYVFALIFISIMILLTPHNLPLTGEERAIIGEAYHPFSKFFGVMTGKLAVLNVIIMCTFFTFLMYRRANKGKMAHISEQGVVGKGVIVGMGVILVTLHILYAFSSANAEDISEVKHFFTPIFIDLMVFAGSLVVSVILTLLNKGKLAVSINFGVCFLTVVLFLGTYGFVVMSKANLIMRYITVSQVLMVLSCMFMNAVIDIIIFRKCKIIGPIAMGKIAPRSQYALIFVCVAIVTIMGVMGFIRSGLRMDWHIYGIMQDTSSNAFTPSIMLMGVTVAGTVALYFVLVTFVFYLAGLGDKKKKIKVAGQTNNDDVIHVISAVTDNG